MAPLVSVVRIHKGKVSKFVSADVHLEDALVDGRQSNWDASEHLVKVLCLARITLGGKGQQVNFSTPVGKSNEFFTDSSEIMQLFNWDVICQEFYRVKILIVQ